MTKTNVMRILDQNNIAYSAYYYEVDDEDLSGETVANKINAEPESVFKTLVAEGDKNGINVFCIPVTEELNLKKCASASRNKKIELIKIKELQPLTGYIRGGCSPIGMKKKFPTYIDDTAQLFDQIYFSAGTRGIQLKIAPLDLQKISEAVFADLI